MNSFGIQVDDLQHTGEGDGSVPAAVTIRSGEDVFTRLFEADNPEPRDYLIVPPEHLAFWLVDNWWRIRWESVPPNGMSASWRLAHQLSSVGGGYIWPRLTIWGEGERVGLMAQPDGSKSDLPIRFVTGALKFAQGLQFEEEVDRFLDHVVTACVQTSNPNALRAQVKALREERADEHLAAWRRMEARLGFDPDAAPENLMDELASLVERYGASAVEEAAQATPGRDAASILIREIQATRDCHHECDFAPATVYVAGPAGVSHDLQEAPWEAAERTAASLRTAIGVEGGPLSNARLAEVLGTQKSALSTPSQRTNRGNLRYGLRLRQPDRGVTWVSLMSNRSQDRRFEICRALGDTLWASNDALGPLARSKTARQKFQRAFAQSLLCPSGEVLDMLDRKSGLNDASITATAKRYQVSEKVVKTILVNKSVANARILGQKAQNPRRLSRMIEAA
jgi:hypothetical protein